MEPTQANAVAGEDVRMLLLHTLFHILAYYESMRSGGDRSWLGQTH